MTRPFWLRFAWTRGLWLPLVPALIGIWLTVVSDSEAERARLLADYGIISEAQITDRQRNEQRDGEGRVTEVTWWVTARFVTPEGQDVTRRVAVSEVYFDSTALGDTVPVTHLPDDPGILELEPGRTEGASRSSRIAAIGAWVIAAGLGLWLWRQNAAAIRAAGRGERIVARVTGHVPMRARQAQRPRARLEWREDAGQTGHSGPLTAEELQRYPVGGTVTLCVDPATGARFWCRDLGLDD